MAKEKIIGIDLGTSNSAAAVMQGGRPVIVPSAEGASLYGKAFPSVVAFTKDGQKLVGEPARRQAISNPDATIIGAKRKMGSAFKYTIRGKEHTPQEISSAILQKIKKDAEEFLGEPVSKAVITVPAYFDDDQRQATKDAGEIAGLEVVRIINEPTAASLSYGLDKMDQEAKIVVFDLGGGTLDVTVMEFGDGIFEVKSTSGDTQLGGQDMDQMIMDWILTEFKDKEGVDLKDDSTALQRVREAAEKAKIELSTTLESEINLPFIHGQKNLTLKLTRAKLEDLVSEIITKCKKPLLQSIKDAKMEIKDVNKVILVGGPTRMPVVREFVESTLGVKAERGVDPMEAVAAGASIQAGVLSGDVKDILLLDVTPLTLGIETLGGIRTPLIPRNTTVPTKKTQVFSTADDNQPAVTINVLQGEREMASANKSLGKVELTGIPPAARGVPQIEVTFDIDANGILHVSGKDMGTGKEQSMKITASQKLKDSDIEQMKKEAEDNAEQDKEFKERVETNNEAEALVYTIEKTLGDLKGKVPEKDIEEITKEKDELKEIMKLEEHKQLKEKMDAINKKLQEVSSKLYEQAQKAEAASKQTEVGDDKVVDAEVVDEEEKK
jgi:molecular chaperone DnaK